MSITYIGANDITLDLFEGQYPIPQGISYNSYLILDKKIAIMDTIDKRATGEWLKHMDSALNGRKVDYLIVSHMEPDHASNIRTLADRYPDMKIVGNTKTFPMIAQFFDNIDLTDRTITVKEGDTLSLGEHTLQFLMAPMIHWPEVMMVYEQHEKILFSADAFGKFGALNQTDDWCTEARRYYINIVGKYGAQVQNLLKKAASLDIRAIYPLHGPVLTENLEYYIDKYNTWSSYVPEEEGVLIAYASIYGNTANAARELSMLLRERGEKHVVISDLSREPISAVTANAFRFDRMVIAASSYDGGMFPCMEEFLNHLKRKSFQKRTVGIIENGSWAPVSGKAMKNILETMKEITIAEPIVTIKSSLNDDSRKQLASLADIMVK